MSKANLNKDEQADQALQRQVIKWHKSSVTLERTRLTQLKNYAKKLLNREKAQK